MKRIDTRRLHMALTDANLSQKELAILSGTSEASMSRYFCGVRTPNTSKAIRMASALGVTVEWLYGDVAPEEKDESCKRTMALIRSYADDWSNKSKREMIKALLESIK